MCYQFAGLELLTAEWLTAIGTWVIGAAAIVYARAAHMLNVRNREQDEARQKSNTSRAALSIATKLIRPQIYAFSGEKSLREWMKLDPIPLELVKERFATLIRDLGEFQAAESELQNLDADLATEVRKLSEILSKLLTVLRRSASVLEQSSGMELDRQTTLRLMDLSASQLREFVDGSLIVGKRLGPSELVIKPIQP